MTRTAHTEDGIEALRARLSQAGAGGGVVEAAGRDKLVGEALAKFLPLVSAAAGSEDVPVPADDFAVILGLLKASLPNQASAVEAAYERALCEMEATFRRNKERLRLVGLMREKFRNEIAALAPSPSAGKPVTARDFAGCCEPHDDVERTIAIVRSAYDWQVSTDGILCGLVAGDMGYASTHIRLNLDELPNATPPAPPVPSVEAVEDRAKAAWNAISDGPNQWHCLSLDERDTYAEFAAALASLTAPTQGDGGLVEIPAIQRYGPIAPMVERFDDKWLADGDSVHVLPTPSPSPVSAPAGEVVGAGYERPLYCPNCRALQPSRAALSNTPGQEAVPVAWRYRVKRWHNGKPGPWALSDEPDTPNLWASDAGYEVEALGVIAHPAGEKGGRS